VSSLRFVGALLLVTALSAAPPSAGVDGPAAANASRGRDQILAEVAANPPPPVDVPAMADAEYAKRFAARRDAVRQKRAALAIELYKTAPVASEVPALMAERWETLARGKGFTFFLLMFALPIFPSDLMSYVAGFTDISPRRYLAANLLGHLPCAITASLVGAYGLSFTPQAWAAVAAAIAAAAVIRTIIFISP